MDREMMEMAAKAGGGGGGLGGMLDTLMNTGPALALSLVFAATAYFFIFWERRKDDSPNKDDGQVGLKVVMYALLILAIGIAAGGLSAILDFLLAGAKNTPQIKGGIAHLLAGGVLFAGIFFAVMPRTNAKEYNKTERAASAFLALAFGIHTFIALDGLLAGLFGGAPWKLVSAGHFANLLVYGPLAFLALARIGGMSGWTAPVRMPQMPPGFPPAGGGQPPQQGFGQQGYPQQGGGYPPQGGGYPPQGGGYPPQGGGYPPQGGGGYPPQGGGGLPPPGGYQPR